MKDQASNSMLPRQLIPIVRGFRAQHGPAAASDLLALGAVQPAAGGVDRCDGLTGLAQQMCYATVYGI